MSLTNLQWLGVAAFGVFAMAANTAAFADPCTVRCMKKGEPAKQVFTKEIATNSPSAAASCQKFAQQSVAKCVGGRSAVFTFQGKNGRIEKK